MGSVRSTQLEIVSIILMDHPSADSLGVITRSVSASHFEGRKEMFYITTDSTHFIYGYMVSDIW